MTTATFRRIVYAYYKKEGRALPWRNSFDPYRIAVSELMLQQTQVTRAVVKYREFLRAFPTVYDLAHAPLGKVLEVWSGLGYNRRAKYLKLLAKRVVGVYGGKFPNTKAELRTLAGIGEYTANAILVFAYNEARVCIETNIRTVYIHHFFPGKKSVTDAEISAVVSKTIDTKNPREWYWALMDYGSYLKQNGNTMHRNSSRYVLQSAFKGSRRAIRGAILRELLVRPRTPADLSGQIGGDEKIIRSVLADLEHEAMVKKQNRRYTIAS